MKEELTIVCAEHDVEDNAKKRERDEPVKINTKKLDYPQTSVWTEPQNSRESSSAVFTEGAVSSPKPQSNIVGGEGVICADCGKQHKIICLQ